MIFDVFNKAAVLGQAAAIAVVDTHTPSRLRRAGIALYQINIRVRRRRR